MRHFIIHTLIFCLPIVLQAQDAPHVEVTRLWTTGQDSIVELENEDFEAGMGNFTNNGIVNWTTTGSEFYQGSQSATSNLVVGGQTAILELSLVVPSGYSATLEFYTRADTSLGGDMVDDTRATFEVDENTFSTGMIDTAWTAHKYFIAEGNHTLAWSAHHDQPTSDDQIQVYLDSVVIEYNLHPALRMADGSEGFGKVLTSDAHGNATWMNLGDISSFENPQGNFLLPLVLDGNNLIDTIVTIKQSTSSGIVVTNSLGIGIEASSNNYGFYTTDNLEDGFYADYNGDDGFVSRYNNGDGFNANNNTRYGFYASDNGQMGFRSQGNTYGFYARDNTSDGFRAYLNDGDGFSADNNTDDGFYASDNGQYGFYAYHNTQDGFYSDFNGDSGFKATKNDFVGFEATINDNAGFYAYSNGDGVYAHNNTDYDAYFSGDVYAGNLSKGGGSFKIDHPLDPENKFLYHSFVESPDMMNVYNGNVVLDENGEAVVQMEKWFEPLNRDFRYQLTCVGGFAPVYIAEKINRNRFKIAGGTPGLEVSWQVTGIRQDPYAIHNRIQVEVDKPAKFKGYYLHPDAYGLGFEQGFDFVKLGYKTLEKLRAESEAKLELQEK